MFADIADVEMDDREIVHPENEWTVRMMEECADEPLNPFMITHVKMLLELCQKDEIIMRSPKHFMEGVEQTIWRLKEIEKMEVFSHSVNEVDSKRYRGKDCHDYFKSISDQHKTKELVPPPPLPCLILASNASLFVMSCPRNL